MLAVSTRNLLRSARLCVPMLRARTVLTCQAVSYTAPY